MIYLCCHNVMSYHVSVPILSPFLFMQYLYFLSNFIIVRNMTVDMVIIESVDSICRDGADTPIKP